MPCFIKFEENASFIFKYNKDNFNNKMQKYSCHNFMIEINMQVLKIRKINYKLMPINIFESEYKLGEKAMSKAFFFEKCEK